MKTCITTKTFDAATPTVRLRVYLYWANPRPCTVGELKRAVYAEYVSAFLMVDLRNKWVRRIRRGVYAVTPKGMRYYSTFARAHLFYTEG